MNQALVIWAPIDDTQDGDLVLLGLAAALLSAAVLCLRSLGHKVHQPTEVTLPSGFRVTVHGSHLD